MSSAKTAAGKDYSIIFDQMEAAKSYPDFVIINDTICAVEKLQDPIEKLRQIVTDKEDYDYRAIIMT